MRVLLQRVSRAEVRVGERVTGRIGKGFCLLVGFTHGDGDEQVDWMAEKIVGIRLFGDADEKMNLSLADVGGAVLLVSQFTLYGERGGGRVSSMRRARRTPNRSTSGSSRACASVVRWWRRGSLVR